MIGMKKAFTIIVCCVLFAGLGWLGVRQLLIIAAEAEAAEILQDIGDEADAETVVEITRRVHEDFQHQSSSSIFWYRMRPYLTNSRLPEIVRLPDGILETLVKAGECDNASRMLGFTLKKAGFSSNQLNLVTPRRAHSGRVVEVGSDIEIYADPFYGVVTTGNTGQNSGFATAVSRFKAGEDIQAIFETLGPASEMDFYNQLDSTFYGRQGEPLTITSFLPVPQKGEELLMGARDGSEADVVSAASQAGMTPHWHYIGHRYDRSWIRELVARANLSVSFVLVDDPEPGVMTASPPPNIEGKTLTWQLEAGQKITFVDGAASISWTRLNSYLPVDQIVVKQLGS